MCSVALRLAPLPGGPRGRLTTAPPVSAFPLVPPLPLPAPLAAGATRPPFPSTRVKPGSHQRFASVRRAERERGAYENKGAGGQNRSRRSRSAHNPRSFRRSQCEPVKNTPTAAAEERVSNGGDTFRSKMDLFYLLALNVERW